MESSQAPTKVLIVHEDADLREELRSCLEPRFSVSPAGEELPEGGFVLRIGDAEAHRLLEVRIEADDAERERYKRLLAETKRTIKRQQRDLAAAKVRLEEANEKLRRFASTDGLTGLYNHRYFQVTWRREITRARRYGEELSVMLMDLDAFKELNDLHGHHEGDVVLREFSQLLLRSVRAVDLVARYGGEEFVVSLPRTGKEAAVMLAERLRVRVEAHAFPHAGTQPEGRLTISVGVATFPNDGDTAGEILGRADRAMARAKASGRNAVMAAEPGDPSDTFPQQDEDGSGDFDTLRGGVE